MKSSCTVLLAPLVLIVGAEAAVDGRALALAMGTDPPVVADAGTSAAESKAKLRKRTWLANHDG